MSKISVAVVVLGVLMLTNSISAAPSEAVNKFVGSMRETFLAVAEMAGDLLKGGNVVEKVKEKVGAAIGKFTGGGGGRGKRSIKASVAITKMNRTDYQRMELNKSWDKDHEKSEELACLVKENEIYWLDFMTSAMVQIMQEMKRVLDGKTVPFKMTKDAYEKARMKMKQ